MYEFDFTKNYFYFRLRLEIDDDPELGRGNRKRKKRKFFDDENENPMISASASLLNGSPLSKLPYKSLENLVRKDVFSPDPDPATLEGGNSLPEPIQDRNSAFLKPVTQNLNSEVMKSWSAHQVAAFVSRVPRLNCDISALSEKIIEEELDGVAFMLMTQNDFVNLLGVKLGPAIKIFNVLLLVKKQTVNEELKAL